MLAPGTPAIGSHASLFRTVRAVSVNAGLSFLRFAPPREFLCDAGVQACRISGTAPVIPGDLVVSVFRVARPCRRPGGQCLPPFVFFCLFVFSVCFCSCCFLLPFSGVLPCSCQCAGGLWFVVSVFHATTALPLCFLSCLRLAACPALRRRQSCQPDSLFLCFT